MKTWSQELCAEKPEELQLVAPDTYLQRKDIEEYQEPEKDGMPAHSGWKCMSREISVSEYNMLQSFAEIKTDEAIDAYTLQLMEEGIL